MLTMFSPSYRKLAIYSAISLLSVTMLGFGQDPSVDPGQNPPPPPRSSPNWQKFGTPAPNAVPQYNTNNWGPQGNSGPQTNPYGPGPQSSPYGPGPQNNPYGPGPQSSPYGPAPQTQSVPVPGHITIPAGTFITVHVDQYLSSDKNQAGDSFSATLARPLVADGFIVAQRGETVGGRVIDAKKAGRVKGVSHLHITLNGLTLADGHQVPVETELTSITGRTSNGRDAAAIVTTTGVGAAIGGAAAWGPGAAIGAGAGLVAGTVGVLVTRGRPTVIYPESQLTFRLARSVTFSTARAPQAFVDARTLNTQQALVQRPPQGQPPAYVGAPYPYPPPYPYYYGPYYPYYWGPSFGLYFGGPRFYGRGFYFRR